MSTTVTVLCARTAGRTPPAPSDGRQLPTPPGTVAWGFASVTAALAAAATLVSANPAACAGVDVGDLDTDGSDAAGEDLDGPLAGAARLCAIAKPGEILVPEVVRLLAKEWKGPAPRPLEGEPGVFVLAPPAATVGDVAVVFPTQLAFEGPFGFVDRPTALAKLNEAWAESLEGRSGTVFLAGEAGAGKTRLLAEFARTAADAGAIVLYGASIEDREVPFQPFVEALRPVVDALGADGLDRILPAGARDDLARLIPGLGAPATQGSWNPIGHGGGPETDRHWAFEAVVDLLNGLRKERPVLLGVDDLHWAGQPTVRLLEHVLRSNRLEGVCLVAAYRDTRSDQSAPFGDVLGNLARRPGVIRVGVDAFDDEAITAFVTTATGEGRLPASLQPVVPYLADRTEGNPFLLVESWRHLLEAGAVARAAGSWTVGSLAAVTSPASVQEVTARRLARLPPAGRDLLRLAACAGASVEIGVVAEAGQCSIEVALELLSQAAEAGVVVQVRPGRFAFVHGLVRQAIEDSLSAAERPRHHLEIARTLESRRDADPAVLAHHYADAVPLEPPATAVAHARQAAARSMETVSFDRAIDVLRTALAVCDDDGIRCELLCELGLVCARSGASIEAAQVCTEAADLARQGGDVRNLVRAAQALAEATWRGTLYGAPAVALLEEALELSADPAERCALLSGLSSSLAFTGREREAAAVGDRAIALAEELGSRPLLLDAIHTALYTSMNPENVHRQLDLAYRGIEVSREDGDEYAEMRLGCKSMLRLFIAADPDRLAAEHERHRYLNERQRQPYYHLVHAGNEVALALGEGRFEEAEAAVDRYQSWADVNGRSGSGYGIQMFSIRREQGRLGELRPTLELAAKLRRDEPEWAPGLAAFYAEAGMAEEATATLDRVAADDLASLPRDSLLAGVLSYLADAAYLSGHRRTAQAALPLLQPYSGLMVYVPGLACYGAADRYLGKLHEVLGRRADARRHLEAALAVDRRTGWDTWIAHSAFALGRHLARHGRSGDRRRGIELMTLARDTAQRLGMAALLERCTVALDDPSLPASDTAHVGLTNRELEVLELLALGRSNREIGNDLNASQHTIANHVRAILQKTGSANRTEAAAWAHRNPLAEPGPS